MKKIKKPWTPNSHLYVAGSSKNKRPSQDSSVRGSTKQCMNVCQPRKGPVKKSVIRVLGSAGCCGLQAGPKSLLLTPLL